MLANIRLYYGSISHSLIQHISSALLVGVSSFRDLVALDPSGLPIGGLPVCVYRGFAFCSSAILSTSSPACGFSSFGSRHAHNSTLNRQSLQHVLNGCVIFA